MALGGEPLLAQPREAAGRAGGRVLAPAPESLVTAHLFPPLRPAGKSGSLELALEGGLTLRELANARKGDALHPEPAVKPSPAQRRADPSSGRRCHLSSFSPSRTGPATPGSRASAGLLSPLLCSYPLAAHMIPQALEPRAQITLKTRKQHPRASFPSGTAHWQPWDRKTG